jgi:hypothetical protein
MQGSMDLGTGAVSSAAQDTGLLLNLRTGYLDDRRATLQPGHKLYVVFADAYRRQNGWSNAEHCKWWAVHLGLWPSSGGSRPNQEGLAFVLAMGRLEGFGYRDVIDKMPGRSWADIRDRGIADIADKMFEELTNPAEPPGLPDPELLSDGSVSFPGPAQPHVAEVLRRWRLPRIWADTGDGAEEQALPRPLAGYINLPHETGDVRAFAAVGSGSLDAVESGCAALRRLRVSGSGNSGQIDEAEEFGREMGAWLRQELADDDEPNAGDGRSAA